MTDRQADAQRSAPRPPEGNIAKGAQQTALAAGLSDLRTQSAGGEERMSELVCFRCEVHFRNCWERCPECDRAEIERLHAYIAELESIIAIRTDIVLEDVRAKSVQFVHQRWK